MTTGYITCQPDVGTLDSTQKLYRHVPATYGLFCGMWEIFGEQTARVLPQGCPHFLFETVFQVSFYNLLFI